MEKKNPNIYFTERQLDLISDIKLLREEDWKEASVSDRLTVLQECERRISNFENRSTSPVKPFSFDDPNILGNFSKDKEIFISESVLCGGSSYEALSVLVEESHHAFQKHALENPGFYTGSFMEEWNKNSENYHNPPKATDPPEVKFQKWKEYVNQPLEKTAQENAKEVVSTLQNEHSLQKSLEEREQQAKDLNSEKLKSKITKNEQFSYRLHEDGKNSELVVLHKNGEEQRIKVLELVDKLPEQYKQKLIEIANKEKEIATQKLELEQQGSLQKQQEYDRDRDR